MSRPAHRNPPYLVVPLLGLLLCWGAGRSSSPDIRFSGYLSNLLVRESFVGGFGQLTGRSSSLWLNLSRLRLRPRLEVSAALWFQLEYELDALYLNHPALFLPVPQKTRRQLVRAIWSPVRENRFQLTHFVDRAFLRVEGLSYRLTVGRQRIAWGSGRIWNPTDLFNPLNPAAFDRIERDGADLISLKWYHGPFSDLEVVFQPQKHFDKASAALRYHTHFGQYDVALMSGLFERRWVLGGDFAGNLGQAGVRGEWLLATASGGAAHPFLKWILGIDHQLNPKLYGLLELHYNGEGRRSPAEYQLDRLLRGEILNLNRWYLFARLAYQLHPLLAVNFNWNANLVDGSGFLNSGLQLSATANLDLTLAVQATYGDPLEEYWYYPTALFFQLIRYF